MNSDLVVDFVNTLDLRPYREELETPAALRDWLLARELLTRGARVTGADLAETLRVREALRDLLAAKNGLTADTDAATATLDEAAHRAGLAVRFEAADSRFEASAPGVRGAVGRVLAEVAAGMADGTWERMKACRAEDCRWAYLDTAKNKTRAWCSMRSCGNRAKVQAYRDRHRH